MCDYSLYYSMAKSRLGLAVIINNLEAEQEPTKKDVEVMGNVLRDIGRPSPLSIPSNPLEQGSRWRSTGI